MASVSSTAKRKMAASASENQSDKKPCWTMGLHSAIADESVQVYKDELCTVIRDKFPKARIHLLVIPNEFIADLKSVNGEHLALLKHMLKIGKEVAEKNAAKANARGASAQFRYGYHAIPSMTMLHMHVISQDFVSDSLKTKKHWNSFTTDYFLDASAVIDDLQANGSIRVDTVRMRKLLDNELACHRCSNKFKTIPKLKEHLLSHAS